MKPLKWPLIYRNCLRALPLKIINKKRPPSTCLVYWKKITKRKESMIDSVTQARYIKAGLLLMQFLSHEHVPTTVNKLSCVVKAFFYLNLHKIWLRYGGIIGYWVPSLCKSPCSSQPMTNQILAEQTLNPMLKNQMMHEIKMLLQTNYCFEEI